MNDQNLSKLRKVFKVLGIILVVVIGASVLIALNVLGFSYVWILVGPLFGVAFYMLAPRTPRAIRIVKSIFPPVVNELISRQEQMNHNISVVQKMGYALRFYEFYDIDKDENLYERLINSLPDVNDDEARIENCARTVALDLESSRSLPFLPSSQLLKLLYKERHSQPTRTLWEKEREQLVPGLAETLLMNHRLRKKEDAVAYSKHDLERFLQRFDNYAFEQVEEQVERLNKIYYCTSDYLKFLTEHGVEHRKALENAATVLGYIKPERLPLKPADFETTLEVLTAVGEEAIRAAFPSLSGNLLSSFCLVSLALFFTDSLLTNNSEMLKMVCHGAAKKGEAIQITFAYLEFKEDLRIEGKLDDRDFVSVRYLMKNWATKVEERERDLKGFDKEIQQITETLRKGEWVTGLSYVLEKTYEKIRQDSLIIREIHAKVSERPFIKESLRRVFRTLTLETVERYLETRKINAYLLTFMSDEGSVSTLLNCIVAPEKQTTFEKLGISLQANGLTKYNFKQYTDHARIGVVPKGWSLEKFYKTFQQDFLKVIEFRTDIAPIPKKGGKKKDEWNWNTKDLKDIELIIHRFGLSGRNYHGFISNYTKDYAIERIKELFSGILSTEDILAVIGYEKDEVSILKALMEGPITELISDLSEEVTIKDDERNLFEARQESLRTEILAVFGYHSAADFGLRLRGDLVFAEQAIAVAAEKLFKLLAGSSPPFSEARCEVIIRAYFETLMAIANIGA